MPFLTTVVYIVHYLTLNSVPRERKDNKIFYQWINCAGSSISNHTASGNRITIPQVFCPICNKNFDTSVMLEHADACLASKHNRFSITILVKMMKFLIIHMQKYKIYRNSNKDIYNFYCSNVDQVRCFRHQHSLQLKYKKIFV